MIINPYAFSAAPSAYLLEENFEGTGYEKSWTETGTPDEDYSTSGLDMQGSQCMRCNASSYYITHTLGASHSTFELYFQMRWAAWPTTARNCLILQNSAGVTQLLLLKGTTTGITLRVPDSTRQITISGLALNTTYHFWVRYVAGTGANAVGEIAISTDGTRPTTGSFFGSITNGLSTDSINKIQIGMTGVAATIDMFVDRILAANTSIGNNP